MPDLQEQARPLLKASELVVARMQRVILDGVSIEMRRSELVSVMGTNGSGKSTLLLALTARLALSNGTLSINSDRSSRLKIGWANQIPRAYPTATVIEHSLGPHYVTKHSRKDWATKKQEILSILDALEFSYIADRLCGTLSTGELRIAELARALFHGTDLLFLDEPTAGLSTMVSGRLAGYLKAKASQGCSILVVTHDRAWEQALSTRRLRLSGGTLGHAG